MPAARVFTRDQLDTLGLPHDLATEENAAEFPEAAVELHREQVDTRRWVSVHELVFRAPDDGKTYAVTYEQGLTELQEDTDPWDYAKEIRALEVEARAVVITEWHSVASKAADRPAALTTAERQFLTYALDLAADQMASRGNEFGDEDTAALEKLRRMADEQPS
jgi:hypothetical protein